MKKKPKVEFIPLFQKCTYHDEKEEDGICKNCHDTGKYKDGYYMIVNGVAFYVDTLK